MTKYNMLKDEFKMFEAKRKELLNKLRDAGNDAGEALQQSSETWHDNAPLDVARLAGELASKQLREVQRIIENANIVSENTKDEVVAIGKKIKILIDNNDEKTILIGGYQTPIDGRVSYTAPIINSLIGKTVGDIEEILLGGKNVDIEILEILDGLDISSIG